MPIKPENRALYDPSWRLISWVVRYFRASGQCEWREETGERCTRRDGEPIPGNAKGSPTILTVMHLDHCPENNSLINLLAACQMHHLRYDAKHHAKNAQATRNKKKASQYEGVLF